MSHPHIKLTYFDISARAEAIRLAFHWGGIKFEDERLVARGSIVLIVITSRDCFALIGFFYCDLNTLSLMMATRMYFMQMLSEFTDR